MNRPARTQPRHAGTTLPVADSDVSAWGAWMGHAIPPEVCRHIAEKINERAIVGAGADVLAERLRQVEAEGWTPEHDDTHTEGQLGEAAGVYALAACSHGYRWVLRGSPVNDNLKAAMNLWPWHLDWFKPSGRRRDLVKAAALILAEIDRLDRADRSAS